jgi:hypothetical protein
MHHAARTARPAFLTVAACLAVTLGGCAGLHMLDSEVSTFGEWPAGRSRGSYAFERLPSQQADSPKQQRLEEAARGALDAAGFKPSDRAETADVTVQLGARIDRSDRSPFDDPHWWHGGLYGSRYASGGWGSGWGGNIGLGFGRGGFGLGLGFNDYEDNRRYTREVVVLIRDRKSGAALYEARAHSSGISPAVGSLLSAMYAAALADFPHSDPAPRNVTTPVAH